MVRKQIIQGPDNADTGMRTHHTPVHSIYQDQDLAIVIEDVQPFVRNVTMNEDADSGRFGMTLTAKPGEETGGGGTDGVRLCRYSLKLNGNSADSGAATAAFENDTSGLLEGTVWAFPFWQTNTLRSQISSQGPAFWAVRYRVVEVDPSTQLKLWNIVDESTVGTHSWHSDIPTLDEIDHVEVSSV